MLYQVITAGGVLPPWAHYGSRWPLKWQGSAVCTRGWWRFFRLLFDDCYSLMARASTEIRTPITPRKTVARVCSGVHGVLGVRPLHMS